MKHSEGNRELIRKAVSKRRNSDSFGLKQWYLYCAAVSNPGLPTPRPDKHPGRQLRPPSFLHTRRESMAYQALGFELTYEMANVSDQLGPRCVEFLLQHVGHLIKGEPLLQHSPDLQSNRIDTETDALLDVQQDRSVFTRGFPDSGCDCDA